MSNKVVIMSKPRDTEITKMFQYFWYISLRYKHFTGQVNRSLIIDEVPMSEIEDLRQVILEQVWDNVVVLCVKEKTNEFKRIERLFQ